MVGFWDNELQTGMFYNQQLVEKIGLSSSRVKLCCFRCLVGNASQIIVFFVERHLLRSRVCWQSTHQPFSYTAKALQMCLSVAVSPGRSSSRPLSDSGLGSGLAILKIKPLFCWLDVSLAPFHLQLSSRRVCTNTYWYCSHFLPPWLKAPVKLIF